MASRLDRIIVIRPDRIGDVVLSLPVFDALKSIFPNTQLTAFVRKPLTPLVQRHLAVTNVFAYDEQGEHAGFLGFWQLVRELRAGHYAAALTLQVSFRVTLAVFFAGIPVRVGPYSKWFSYLLFSRGIRQKRSHVEKHEMEYNLDLIHALPGVDQSKTLKVTGPRIAVSPDALKRVSAFSSSLGRFAVVHPGMGGSALNWPAENFAEVVAQIAAAGTSVVVSGAAGERNLVEQVSRLAKSKVGDSAVRERIHVFIGELTPESLEDLIALLSQAAVMVAPSTGPLHLAAAVGVRTVSFYPLIRVQSEKRWGPRGADWPNNSQHHVVLSPTKPDLSDSAAMVSITVDSAVKNIVSHLRTFD